MNKDEFMKLSSEYGYLPVYREYSAALETPLSAFLKLRESEEAFLLESVEAGRSLGRYSFVGFSPEKLFKIEQGEACVSELNSRSGKREEKILPEKDPLTALEKLLEERRVPLLEDLPLFSGGAVGYFGFEIIASWEKLQFKLKDEKGFPDCLLAFFNEFIVFDHVRQSFKIVAVTQCTEKVEEDYEAAVQKIESIHKKLNTEEHKKKTGKFSREKTVTNTITTSCEKEEFMEIVDKAKEYILAGDIFQVVLSRQSSFQLSVDPLEIYLELRMLNPSPYMFFLDFGEYYLVGSSPEVMVKLEGREAELCPIAGTRPRGKTPAEDEELSRELLGDEKELAEHLMLLDLGRNDLGRVCEYGTVKVVKKMVVENYSHVKHIVSQVKGKLATGKNAFDLLRAALPAGTVSGAPKIRALEIIEELESVRRGPYAGCVGYLSYNGNMDTCISIRTMFVKDRLAFLQAGAGIVADSNPEREFEEVVNKAGALLRAIEKAEGGDEGDLGNR